MAAAIVALAPPLAARRGLAPRRRHPGAAAAPPPFKRRAGPLPPPSALPFLSWGRARRPAPPPPRDPLADPPPPPLTARDAKLCAAAGVDTPRDLLVSGRRGKSEGTGAAGALSLPNLAPLLSHAARLSSLTLQDLIACLLLAECVYKEADVGRAAATARLCGLAGTFPPSLVPPLRLVWVGDWGGDEEGEGRPQRRRRRRRRRGEDEAEEEEEEAGGAGGGGQAAAAAAGGGGAGARAGAAPPPPPPPPGFCRRRLPRHGALYVAFRGTKRRADLAVNADVAPAPAWESGGGAPPAHPPPAGRTAGLSAGRAPSRPRPSTRTRPARAGAWC